MQLADKFRYLDLFGQPFSILVDHSKLHKTILGALFSCAIMAIVMYSFVTSVNQSIQGTSPKVTTYKSPLPPQEVSGIIKFRNIYLGKMSSCLPSRSLPRSERSFRTTRIKPILLWTLPCVPASRRKLTALFFPLNFVEIRLQKRQRYFLPSNLL